MALARLALVVLQTSMPSDSGLHELRLAREGRADVVYTLSLPDGFDPEGDPRPLVIALHYAGKNRDHFGRGVLEGLVEPGLRHLRPIIAAPDAPARGFTDRAAEDAVLALLDHLQAAYPVDPKRVLVTGFSMGGMGTWFLASRHPNRFTAAIPIAGSPRALAEEGWGALEALPLHAIHSVDDEVVAIEPTRKAVAELKASGAPAELTELSGVTHYNVPGFVGSLKDASKWLERVWGR